MIFIREKFEIQSEGQHPTFHNITEQVKIFWKDREVKNGMVTVYSPSYDLFGNGSGMFP